MNSFNPFKVTAEITKDFTNLIGFVKDSEDIEQMKKRASRAIGFIDGLHSMTNGMISFANNDFTGDFNRLLDEMTADVYQACIDKALELKCDDLFWEYAKRRDEYSESARD